VVEAKRSASNNVVIMVGVASSMTAAYCASLTGA
jgi:hypothetical protein